MSTKYDVGIEICGGGSFYGIHCDHNFCIGHDDQRSFWGMGHILPRLEATKQFYEDVDREEFKALKKKLYEHMLKNPVYCEASCEFAPSIMAFYDKWGALACNRFLPLWIFKGNHGYNVIVYYDFFKPYIEERRKESSNNKTNHSYVKHFELLAKKIRRKYKY